MNITVVKNVSNGFNLFKGGHFKSKYLIFCQNLGVGRKYLLSKTVSKIISVSFIIITLVKTSINVNFVKLDHFL